MKKILMTVLLFVVTSEVFAIPTLTEASATGTTVKFTTKLSEKLPTGYKVKIDLNNGKGLVAMTCSVLTCSLSSNSLPKNTDSPTYKIGIYDAKGVLQGATIDGSYFIVSTSYPSGYTKISNSGAVLPDTATLGSGANDWACTKDNKTGLTWEVKTDDGGLRDMNKKYTNYSLGENGYDNSDNASVFVKTVNKQTLCGAANWRLPTVNELMLVKCPDGKYDVVGSCINYNSISNHTINSTYFPNTVSYWYWSSSPSSNGSNWARSVDFRDRFYSANYGSKNNFFVRLVR